MTSIRPISALQPIALCWIRTSLAVSMIGVLRLRVIGKQPTKVNPRLQRTRAREHLTESNAPLPLSVANFTSLFEVALGLTFMTHYGILASVPYKRNNPGKQRDPGTGYRPCIGKFRKETT